MSKGMLGATAPAPPPGLPAPDERNLVPCLSLADAIETVSQVSTTTSTPVNGSAQQFDLFAALGNSWTFDSCCNQQFKYSQSMPEPWLQANTPSDSGSEGRVKVSLAAEVLDSGTRSRSGSCTPHSCPPQDGAAGSVFDWNFSEYPQLYSQLAAPSDYSWMASSTTPTEEKSAPPVRLSLATETLDVSDRSSRSSSVDARTSGFPQSTLPSVSASWPSSDNLSETATAAPLRLSLAQVLDPSKSSSQTIDSCETPPVGARPECTIALADVLKADLPTSDGSSKGDRRGKAISLLDAVVGPSEPPLPTYAKGASLKAAECSAPRSLFLADHFGAEDLGDVKEDFLATPLPFVGGRRVDSV